MGTRRVTMEASDVFARSVPMRILMLTNIYTPLVGGITRSVQIFSERLRTRGHEVLVVCPAADSTPKDDDERHVVRIPAIPRAFKNKYSLPVPVPGVLHTTFRDFEPDVVHSHHPFLLGLTAHRGAALWNVPLVYTHHSRYDVYLKTMVKIPDVARDVFLRLSVGYCELCSAIVAPSGAIERMLRDEGIDVPIEVIPTGVEVERFRDGDGAALRARFGIIPNAFVVGHLGRLSPEKNMPFLARGIAEFLRCDDSAHAIIVGEGESRRVMQQEFDRAGVASRVHFAGRLEGRDVIDAYHAMDVFAFASQSETQGMVVTEAMAAGVPVVAVKASGVEDVVRDGENGRLIPEEDVDAFAAAIGWVRNRSEDNRARLRESVLRTAEAFSIEHSVDRLLALYDRVVADEADEEGLLAGWQRFVEYEWNAWSHLMETFYDMTLGTGERAD